MRLYIFYFLCMLFCSPVLAQKVFTYTDTNFIYKLAVKNGDDAYNCTVDSIMILSRNNGRLVQVLIPDESFIRCDFDAKDDQCFAIEDMNFDGHNDMRLLTAMSGTGHNLTYSYWMYNKVTRQFVEDSLYSSFTEPYFSNGTITSSFTMGSEGSGSYEYKLFNGKPRLVSEHYSRYNGFTGNYLISDLKYVYVKGRRVKSWSQEETFDEEKELIVTTTRKLINGKLAVVSRDKVKAEKDPER